MNKNTKPNLFARFLPEWMRTKTTVPDEAILSALASTPDNDPLLKSLLEQLNQGVESHLRAALDVRASDEVIVRFCQRAAALQEAVETIESNRAAAQERKRMLEEQMKNPQKAEN